MNCDTAKSLVFPYVDGELAGTLRSEMYAHLLGCDECRLIVEHELVFREVYVAHLRPDPAPPELRERVDRLIAGFRQPVVTMVPRRRRVSVWRPAVAALLLLAVGVTGGLWLAPTLQHNSLLTRVAEASVDQHEKLARGLLLPDIVGVSPRAAEEWFRGRLNFDIHLPERNNANLTLMGARISHLDSLEVAALEYQVDQVDRRHVTLFVIPEPAFRRLGLSPTPRFTVLNHLGYDVIIWQHHGTGYALVSPNGGRCYFVQNAALSESPNVEAHARL